MPGSVSVNTDVFWEGTKCISLAGGNVTLLVIRAFKLAALPKHCQTLCEGGERLTALSLLILCTGKSAPADLHDIDSKKHGALTTC